jgi:hypothetical protein
MSVAGTALRGYRSKKCRVVDLVRTIPSPAHVKCLVGSLRVGVPGIVLELGGCVMLSVRVKSESVESGRTVHQGALGRVDAVGNDNGWEEG